jgi:signal peptidase I
MKTLKTFTLRHRSTVLVIVAIFAALVVLRIFVVRSFFVPSASMTQTLAIDDHLMVNKLQPLVSGVERGDIVVFSDPGGWLGSAESTFRFDPVGAVADILTGQAFQLTQSQFLVKRVIGVSGDHITCSGPCKNLVINDREVIEPYLSKASENASDQAFDVVVPEGKLWVMGDNRVGSADSRAHQDTVGKGFVSLQDVSGTVFAISWPLNRLRQISEEDSAVLTKITESK